MISRSVKCKWNFARKFKININGFWFLCKGIALKEILFFGNVSMRIIPRFNVKPFFWNVKCFGQSHLFLYNKKDVDWHGMSIVIFESIQFLIYMVQYLKNIEKISMFGDVSSFTIVIFSNLIFWLENDIDFLLQMA